MQERCGGEGRRAHYPKVAGSQILPPLLLQKPGKPLGLFRAASVKLGPRWRVLLQPILRSGLGVCELTLYLTLCLGPGSFGPNFHLCWIFVNKPQQQSAERNQFFSVVLIHYRYFVGGFVPFGADQVYPVLSERLLLLHDPDPVVAKRRRRNASRAATLGNSRIGAEIRSTRLLVWDLVEMTVSNELHPTVRKRLTEVVQLLQVYCRLAELELAAGEKLGKGDVTLPEAIPRAHQGVGGGRGS